MTYDEWISKAEERGDHLLAFSCIHCDQQIKTLAPTQPGRVWDTMAACPHCTGGFFKVVHSDRVVTFDPANPDVRRIAHAIEQERE